VTKEQRSAAKAVNFGLLYGQQAYGLSQELGLDFKQSTRFIETYFAKFQKVKIYIEACKEKARKEGRTTTLFGRERQIPEIHSRNPALKNAAERLAINSPIQGTQADLIKLAMIAIDQRLQKEHFESQMILQIHDELIFEGPEAEMEPLGTLVKEEMEGVVKLSVPLTVDVAVGKNWKMC